MRHIVTMETYCFSCRRCTPHVMVYVGKFLKAGRCQICGAEFQNERQLYRAYFDDLIDRILTKPYRIRHEFRSKGIRILSPKGVRALLARLPRKVLSEGQLLKEMIEREKFPVDGEAGCCQSRNSPGGASKDSSTRRS